MNLIAEKIRQARMKAGMNEKMLAKRCGLSESYVKHVESGKKVINEQSAQRMLQVLGVESDILQQGSQTQESAPEESVKKDHTNKREQQPVQHTIQPNAQWSDALAHIIKRFPVEELETGKVVGQKAVPLLGKKIDGCPWERLRLFRIQDSQLQHLRIMRNDIITVWEKTEVVNGRLYVTEINGRRMIRKLSKQQNKQMAVSTGVPGEKPQIMEINQVKVIGECMKVEFYLS